MLCSLISSCTIIMMESSTNLIEVAKAKLAVLEAELRSTPLYVEIESLRSSIKVFEKISAEGSSAKIAKASDLPKNKNLDLLSGDWRMPHAAKVAQQELQRSSKSEAVTTCAVVLLEKQSPRTTKALLSGMKTMGVDVGGADELANLSAYLSKAGIFDHRRKLGGWFLKGQIQEEENPQAEGTGGSRDMGQSSV